MKKVPAKLRLKKETITHLDEMQLQSKNGGYWTSYCHGHRGLPQKTMGNGNTCPGDATCVAC